MTDIIQFLEYFHQGYTEEDCSLNSPGTPGIFAVKRSEIQGEVLDWVLNYLEQRRCPHQLALCLAKRVAHQVAASVENRLQQSNEDDDSKVKNSSYLKSNTLHAESLNYLRELCSLFLSQPAQIAMLSSTEAAPPFSSSVFAIKNKRRKMEDRHVVIHDLNALMDLEPHPFHSYYAVFDGHAGIEAASYASSHLHLNMIQNSHFFTDTTRAIREAYKLTDVQFCERCETEENIKSGCTAVSALIRDSTLYMAWLGDSQALLIKQGVPIELVVPHKPDRQDERERIEALGGYVLHVGTWRVNGSLAVSRALGDQEFKPFISSEPDIRITNLDGTEDFLILACDGLWDGMSPEDVSSMIYKNLVENPDINPEDGLAEKLVHQSKLQGSDDNISVIVIFLRKISDIIADAPKYIGKCARVMNGKTDYYLSGDSIIQHHLDAVALDMNTTSSERPKDLHDLPSFPSLNTDSMEGLNTDSRHGIAFGLPPEATALSELPTPPIDDIASKQTFGEFPTEEQLQKLQSHIADSEVQESSVDDDLPDTSGSELHTQTEADLLCGYNADKKDPEFDVQEFYTTEVSDTSPIIPGLTVRDITPEEVLSVASDVVSNTIETAKTYVESKVTVSSCSITQAISSPLNPNAEPFVMKNFLPEAIEDGSFLGDHVTAQPVESSEIQNVSENDSPINKQLVFAEKSASEDNQPEIYPVTVESTETPREIVQDQLLEQDLLIGNEEPESNIHHPQEINVGTLLDTSVPVHTAGTLICDQKSDSSVPLPAVEEKLYIDDMIELDIGHPQVQIDSSFPLTSDMFENTTSVDNIENHKVKSFEDQNIASLSAEISSVCLTDLPGQQEPVIDETTRDSVCNLEQGSIQLSNEVDLNCPLDDALLQEKTPNATIQSETTEENASGVEQAPVNELLSQSSDVVSHICDEVASLEIDSTGELESSASNVQGSDDTSSDAAKPVIAVESLLPKEVQAELLKVASEPSTETSAVEESQSTSVAVDLNSVPDGVPEAEGVSEDVDSDSEKDGGWSYVKATNSIGTSSDSQEAVVKPKKATDKKMPASQLKSKKELTKTTKDLPSKAKPSGPIEKPKKPIVGEKKASDSKLRGVPALAKTLPPSRPSPLKSTKAPASSSNKNATSKASDLPPVSSKVSATRQVTTKVQTTARVPSKPAVSSTRPAQPKTQVTGVNATKPSLPTSTISRPKDPSAVSKPTSTLASQKPRVPGAAPTKSNSDIVPKLQAPKKPISTFKKPEPKDMKTNTSKPVPADKVINRLTQTLQKPPLYSSTPKPGALSKKDTAMPSAKPAAVRVAAAKPSTTRPGAVGKNVHVGLKVPSIAAKTDTTKFPRGKKNTNLTKKSDAAQKPKSEVNDEKQQNNVEETRLEANDNKLEEIVAAGQNSVPTENSAEVA